MSLGPLPLLLILGVVVGLLAAPGVRSWRTAHRRRRPTRAHDGANHPPG